MCTFSLSHTGFFEPMFKVNNIMTVFPLTKALGKTMHGCHSIYKLDTEAKGSTVFRILKTNPEGEA